MRPVLIDTNAYVSFKRNESSIIEIVQHAEWLAISPIVIGELVAGFNRGSRAKQNKLELQQFLESPRIVVYPLTLDTSHFFSLVYSSLKNKGKPIPTNDMWIASQALEHGCFICTHDKHFSFVEGLMVGDTLTDLVL